MIIDAAGFRIFVSPYHERICNSRQLNIHSIQLNNECSKSIVFKLSHSNKTLTLMLILLFVTFAVIVRNSVIFAKREHVADHHRLYELLIQNAKNRIESRNAFLEASSSREKKAISEMTLRGAQVVALMTPYFPWYV